MYGVDANSPAIARPVRATRALAPGGSFICPYTSAALEPAIGLPVALSTTSFKHICF